MLNVPAKDKPLIDLTKDDDRDRVLELEREVESLNEMVTHLMFQNGKQKNKRK